MTKEPLVICNRSGIVRACIKCTHGVPHRPCRTDYGNPYPCTEESTCENIPERAGKRVQCVEVSTVAKPEPAVIDHSAIPVEFTARICHEINKAWCEHTGDTSQKHWEEAEQWQRDSAVAGVLFRLNNPGAAVSAQHDSWMADKIKEGWVYGFVKDPVSKTHPCIVPYEELPEEQQMKDHLFVKTVDMVKELFL